ncbi:SIR2 family protein [Prosthecochloris vibrioformis]|uniref:SIR2 family protein n=1 Tax=Prosthecochloris vibrioformis TaxID=1098 RepID=A0A5C4RSX8_PROVB|nr:SIR2 family protein [Prosthecochloris vibrioformis]TNJ34034.1 SIR2 family protein [Prosthecochloris vibrioformis]
MNEKYNVSGRINILRQALASDKNRVAFLLGAGCPLSIRDKESKPLIPDIAGLTTAVCRELDQDKIEKLKTGIVLPGGKEATIEDILSRVRLLIDAIGGSEFDGLKKEDLTDIEKKICDKITQEVNKDLPDKITSYHNLASWISGIPREHPIEIFTPNYDLLVESALETKNIPYFDGFVGSRNAFFDLHTMEYEELPSRWVRLWKLHGSVNWWVDTDGNVFRGVSKNNDKQMIYPSHLKYLQSRRMPYLAMQDRLSNFLSTGQSVLITNGYSFVDQHLNEIITQRLSANPRSVCFGLLYDDIEKYPEALDCAQKTTNLHLLSKDAAFFAGEQKSWEENDDHSYTYLTEKIDSNTKCKIGDFASFSQFLLKQTGDFKMEGQNES